MTPTPHAGPRSNTLGSLVLAAATALASTAFVSKASAQAVPAGDSVEITPSTRYGQSGFLRMFNGAGNRDLWALPIEVEELDLGSLGGGGLTPEYLGGGVMSHTLHMRGVDGREYVARSVDKYPAQGLPEELQNTLVADIVQGVVASLHPTGALVAAPLLEAAGILHATPTYYRMPDDPRLLEFRELFAGELVLFEERPRDTRAGGPSFAGASEIHNTANFMDALERSPRHQLDVREFLKARLIDLLLGDRDRSVNNFLWARFDDGDERHWRTIPRDRDQVFVQFDGMVKAGGRLFDPRYVKFESEYPSIVGLTRNAWDMDRPLLTALEDEEWDEVVAELKATLTDEVIEDAVRHLPASHYAAVGEELTEILKIRRDNLHEAAADFYEIVARHADVHFTDNDELVVVERLTDGSVRITASERSDDSTPSGDPYYSRTFRPERTDDVRIYSHGGDDVFRLTGAGSDAVRIRLMGGGGTDEVEIVAGANVARVEFYDDEDTDRVSPEGAVGTQAFRPGRRLYWPGVGTGAGTPDFGNQISPIGVDAADAEQVRHERVRVGRRIMVVDSQAPPIMNREVRVLLEKEPEMRRAAKLFRDVDILVTAGSSWRIMEISSSGEIRPAPDTGPDPIWDPDDPNPLNTIYSQLRALMRKRDKRGYNKLIKAGTVADMLWQPLTFNGPPQVETEVQAMTLAPLEGIPDFIDDGEKVLFVLGPYEGGFHKGDVLLAALGAEASVDGGRFARPLFTHLVCDHRTARAVMKTVQG